MRRPREALLAAFTLAWIAGILFPMYAATRRGGWSKQLFDWIFYTDTVHVIMHTFLYGVLALLFATFIAKPADSAKKLLVSVLPAVAVVAVLQEAIQMVCRRACFCADNVFDLAVDLAGGVLGTMLFLKASQRRITVTSNQ